MRDPNSFMRLDLPSEKKTESGETLYLTVDCNYCLDSKIVGYCTAVKRPPWCEVGCVSASLTRKQVIFRNCAQCEFLAKYENHRYWQELAGAWVDNYIKPPEPKELAPEEEKASEETFEGCTIETPPLDPNEPEVIRSPIQGKKTKHKPKEEFMYRTINGNYCKETQKLGYCRCNLHRGYLTKKIMDEHECLEKNCIWFDKHEDAPYWQHKTKQRLARKRGKALKREIKQREEACLELIRELTASDYDFYAVSVEIDDDTLKIRAIQFANVDYLYYKTLFKKHCGVNKVEIVQIQNTNSKKREIVKALGLDNTKSVLANSKVKPSVSKEEPIAAPTNTPVELTPAEETLKETIVQSDNTNDNADDNIPIHCEEKKTKNNSLKWRIIRWLLRNEKAKDIIDELIEH